MDEQLTAAQLVQKAIYEKEKGNQHFKKGNYSAAYDHYSRAVKCDPHQPTIWGNRAMALIKMKRFAEAIQDCDAAIRLDPSYIKALYRRGLALKQSKRHEDAKTAFENVLMHDTGNVDALKELKLLAPLIKSKPPKLMEITLNPIKFSDSNRSQKYLRKIPVKIVGHQAGSSQNENAHSESGNMSPASSTEPVTIIDGSVILTQDDAFLESTNLDCPDQKPNGVFPETAINIGAKCNHDNDSDDQIILGPSALKLSSCPADPALPGCSTGPDIDEVSFLSRQTKNPTLSENLGNSKCPFNDGSCEPESRETALAILGLKEKPGVFGLSEMSELSNMPEIPGVPSTAYQFMIDWRLLKNYPELFMEYLEKIPCSAFPTLLKHCLENDVLTSILDSVARFHKNFPQYELAECMACLSRVPRWPTILMLADSRDRANMKTIINSIPLNDPRMSEIKQRCC